MKKLIRLVLPVMILGLLLVGCQSKEETEEEKVIGVMEKNIESLNNEDVEAYMSTISEESPAYGQTKEFIGKIFEAYDLENTIDGKIEVIEIKEGIAKVKMTSISKKISGPDYQDNKSSYINLLKKYDDGWKIINTEVQDVEFFDQE